MPFLDSYLVRYSQMSPHSVFATTLWGQYNWVLMVQDLSVGVPLLGKHCQNIGELPPFLENSLADWAQSVLGWAFTVVCVLRAVNKLYLQLVPVWITARKGRVGSTRPPGTALMASVPPHLVRYLPSAQNAVLALLSVQLTETVLGNEERAFGLGYKAETEDILGREEGSTII